MMYGNIRSDPKRDGPRYANLSMSPRPRRTTPPPISVSRSQAAALAARACDGSPDGLVASVARGLRSSWAAFDADRASLRAWYARVDYEVHCWWQPVAFQLRLVLALLQRLLFGAIKAYAAWFVLLWTCRGLVYWSLGDGYA